MNIDPHYLSWGRYPVVAQRVRPIAWRDQAVLDRDADLVLAQGLARSYGDSCLNEGHTILSLRDLDHVISFDRENGVLRAEAGLSLGAILRIIVPAGWFLPVSPGTQFVTLGGAIANDIHGKNHHCAGTFGRHVKALTLRRSDGRTLRCTPDEHRDLYAATIGGIGLTGIILDATIQLIRIDTGYIQSQEIQFGSLAEFRALSAESAGAYAYTVAWIDCVSTGRHFGRGIFIRGNHARRDNIPASYDRFPAASRPLAVVPFEAPPWVLCPTSVRWFNGAYFHKQTSKVRDLLVPLEPFFYPLDSVRHWNRVYGRSGFFQFQCALPPDPSGRTLDELFKAVVEGGEASFLAVLKEFGGELSPGLMSFPREGTTLCLDFPNRGARTIALYRRLEHMVRAMGGALYPAKDALMEPQSFESFFPRLDEFCRHIDPRCSSSFWRRVTAPRMARMLIS